jgi:hypothetical protein
MVTLIITSRILRHDLVKTKLVITSKVMTKTLIVQKVKSPVPIAAGQR